MNIEIWISHNIHMSQNIIIILIFSVVWKCKNQTQFLGFIKTGSGPKFAEPSNLHLTWLSITHGSLMNICILAFINIFQHVFVGQLHARMPTKCHLTPRFSVGRLASTVGLMLTNSRYSLTGKCQSIWEEAVKRPSTIMLGLA